MSDEHGRENGEIRRGGEVACVSCDALHFIGARVVDFALNPIGVVRIAFFSGGCAFLLLVVGIVAGVDHSERQIDILTDEFVFRHTGYFFNHVSHENEADVAVGKGFARGRAEP